MMKTNLNYCIVLSAEQLTYLAGSKYGIDRMKILHQIKRDRVCHKRLLHDFANRASRSFRSGFVQQVGL